MASKMTDIWDRIIARADKREAAKAQIRAEINARIAGKSQPQLIASASARWDSAIATALVKTNGNRARAVAMASQQNPGLREAFVAEVNANRNTNAAKSQPAARAAATGAKARWQAAINQKITTGTPRAQAVQQVNRENPGLRESMLAEVNGR